jgi:hypothetical protein
MQQGGRDRFDEAAAGSLLAAGWRQGSAFRAPVGLEVPIAYDRDTEWLVVCTQSCSVVSPRLTADPHIEVATARPIKKYSARSPQATGKDFRRFHLPVPGATGFQALECDINRRFNIPRERFLDFAPEPGITVPEGAGRALAGWLSRYYSRIALPNAFVTRSRDSGFFETVKTALDQVHGDGQPLSAAVDGIYVVCTPDTELAEGQPYACDLVFLCATQASASTLGEWLLDPLAPFTRDGGHGGIALIWDTKIRTSTFVDELMGYSRLSEWDYLSDLGDVAEAYGRFPPSPPPIPEDV